MKIRKVSKEEYLKALEIVELYHQQIFKGVSIIDDHLYKDDIKLNNILENCSMSNRLYSILCEYINSYGNVKCYLVDKSNFITIRKAGKKSWLEFVNIREKYLLEKSELNNVSK